MDLGDCSCLSAALATLAAALAGLLTLVRGPLQRSRAAGRMTAETLPLLSAAGTATPPDAHEDRVDRDELARLLGNLGADGSFLPPDATAGIVLEDDAGEDGTHLLEAMERRDSEAALRAVQEASTGVVNFVDDVQRNALLIGVAEGHREAVQALLARDDFHGVNALTNVGSSALHLAAANDFVEIVEDLLACPRFTLGVNCLSNNGLTPLDFALEFGEGDARSVLQDAGCQRRTSNSLGRRRTLRQARLPSEIVNACNAEMPEEEEPAELGEEEPLGAEPGGEERDMDELD